MGVPIRGYPNYLIEPDGRVFSKFSNKYLKFNEKKNHYYSVELFNENGSKRLSVHRLVADAYLPNPNNYPMVNHKDENPHNNSVDNLEWCTAKYNMNYGNCQKKKSASIDYTKPIYRERAIRNSMNRRKPILQFTKDGEFVARHESAADAIRSLGVNFAHITEVAKGKRPSDHGYIWKYERSDDLSEYQY